MSNAVINVAPETRELARQLSDRTSRTMREVVAEALALYEAQLVEQQIEDQSFDRLLTKIEKTAATRVVKELREVIDTTIQEVITELRARKAYKPWLRQSHADDIQEINNGSGNGDDTVEINTI